MVAELEAKIDKHKLKRVPSPDARPSSQKPRPKSAQEVAKAYA